MPDRCTSGCQGSSDPWQNRDFSKCEFWELMRDLLGSISSQLEEFFQYPSNMILPLQMSNIWKNNFGSTAVTWLLDFWSVNYHEKRQIYTSKIPGVTRQQMIRNWLFPQMMNNYSGNIMFWRILKELCYGSLWRYRSLKFARQIGGGK